MPAREEKVGVELDGWEQRVQAVWQRASEAELVIGQIDALAAERQPDDPVAVYERASAQDFAGNEAEAEHLYRQAFALGLHSADRRRTVEATVQLASTLCLLGRPTEAVAVLDRVPVEPADDERDWLAAFRSLALLDAGRPDDAARGALQALSGHLTQYAGVVRTRARA